MGMESGDTTMAGEDAGETTSSPKKLCVKKKSTLAKLKEKKQRELGSSSSLQKFNSKKVENDIDDTLMSNINRDITVNSGYIHLSTKDPPEPRKDKENSEKESRPKPKPRGSRRPSETNVDNLMFDNERDTEKKDAEKEKNRKLYNFETLGSSNDIKLLGVEKLGSVELTPNQGGFIPKPPQTPRTPRTTPRTPRGYIMVGKGDKKKHELESSCYEPEVQEQPFDFNDTENSLEVPIKNSINNVTSLNNSRRIPGQVKLGDRLLKKSSKESLGENINPYSSKPPINQSLTSLNNSNNNSNNQLNTNFLKSNSISEPSKDRLLKLSKSSAPGQALQTQDFTKSKENNLSHLSLTSVPNLESSIGSSKSEVNTLHMHYERLLLSDLEDANKLEAPQGPPILDPIIPKSLPPPLTKEFSSKSLRTSYKIDPNIKKITTLAQTESTLDKADVGTSNSGDRLSQKSYASVSVLPLITTKEARLRIAPPERIIGTEGPDHLTSEIDRYFPDRKVNIFVGTWNMNELKEVSTSLEDFLLPEKCDYVQDIYAVGTQENVTNKKEWEIKIQEVLGPSHVLYHSISHGSLHLVLFIRRDLIWFCSSPEDDVISLRAISMVKTKGAIGIYMTLFGTSYLFINCHLTSDRGNDTSRKKHRLGDYFKVIQDLKLPKGFQTSPSAKKLGPEDITSRFDCVFWFGDLNFRIERERQTVVRKVDEITSEDIPNFETLLQADQLIKYMTEEKIFGGFQEGRINFHPTFKFDLNENVYDTSAKNRVPSYTDRIMFRCKKKNDINCILYDAVMEIKISDHRPVFGHYETGIRPGSDNMIYGAAQFDRNVYLEANRRRAASKPVVKKQSAICLIQ